MLDIDIIKQIEQKLGIILKKRDYFYRLTQSYTLNNGKVNRLGLFDSRIIDLDLIIDELKSLTELIELDLSNNQIVNIHLISTLSQLTILSLGSNQISDIKSLKNFDKLTKLYLENNKIINIYSLENLSDLTELYLDNNEISDIEPIKNLFNLKNIDLKNNNIRYLPRWIVKYRKVIKFEEQHIPYTFNLYGNPIDTPPIEIVKQGLEAIRRYFAQIDEEGIDYIYEAKLILVGDGSAGKTSLQVRLMDAKANLPAGDTRTRGIKIEDWNFKTEHGKKHTSHIWDFGGQDVYYPVHRFFLTENSVFVLLASTRQTQHNFDYWIPTIYQFGGTSPIILGQTCHEGNKAPWNDLGYYLSNPNFKIIRTGTLVYHELNLLNSKNEGLAEIKQTIIQQLTSLPHYGKGVPKSWVVVREKINEEKVRNACITYEKFKELCIEVNPITFASNVNIEDCARFMHSIGVILWYNNNEILKDSVVLRPEWVMNAVYIIIDDDKVQQQNGIIISNDFDLLWHEVHYRNHHRILKQMLEVFKIAFPKKYPKGDYILPARLVSMPTKNRWPANEQCLRLEYKYDFMPRGMVNQLSADLSRYIPTDREVWNNAVNLADGANSSYCQVEEDFYFRKISIRAKGKEGRDLVMLVKDALKNITDGYKGVKPEIYVPCTCGVCIREAIPTMFLYDKLLKWNAAKENAYVTCNESGETLIIDHLLYNVGLPNPIKKERGENNE